MDKQNNPEIPQDDQWLDDILAPHDHNEEIGPDETAVYAAGLTHPSDAKVDQILDEVNNSDWVNEPEILEEAPVDTYDPQNEVYADAPMEDGYADQEYYEEEEEVRPKRKRRPRRKNGNGPRHRFRQ